MKKILLISFILFSNNSFINSRPFASIKVADNLYFDETEVDVGTWISYYSWILKHDGIEAAQKVLPDSNAVELEVWNYFKSNTKQFNSEVARYTLQPLGVGTKKCTISEKLSKRVYSLYNSCNLLSLPITGLSYEQVVAFCCWRTKILPENKVTYRLPTPEEWEDFALKTLTNKERISTIKDSLFNAKCPNYNFKTTFDCDSCLSTGELLGIAMFPSGTNGAYDVFGNVSEMTATKGIAKGGNFQLSASGSNPKNIQSYDKPELWLGFRCIMVKIEKKK